MPALRNPKRELFAIKRSEGLSAVKAFEAAGYRPHRQNAARLSANDDVRRRVGELQAPAIAAAGVSAQRIIDELARIGFVNLGDFIRFDQGGDPRIDLGGLTRDQFAAIADVTVTSRIIHGSEGKPDIELRKLHVRLHDKLNALEKLGKHIGMFKGEAPSNGFHVTIDWRDLLDPGSSDEMIDGTPEK
jgi:phage terminase small subunit